MPWAAENVSDITLYSVCVLVSLTLGATAIYLILRPHKSEPRPPSKSRGFEVLPPANRPESDGKGGDESGI
jgi:hypothetical protein